MAPADATLEVAGIPLSISDAYCLAIVFVAILAGVLVVVDDPVPELKSQGKSPVSHAGDCLASLSELLSYGVFSALLGSGGGEFPRQCDQLTKPSTSLIGRLSTSDHALGQWVYVCTQGSVLRHVATFFTQNRFLLR